MKSPIEELSDIVSREGWGVLMDMQRKFKADVETRLASSCRQNDGRHQLYQGKIDGVQEFFAFVKRELENNKKPTSGASLNGG